MKMTKRILSILLALLMLVAVLPLPVYAATLKITTQPKTSYTEYGATAKATVKAAGDGLKYTWYVKNAGASQYTKSSVTKSTYSVKMSDSTKGRRVYCVVKDKKGKTVKSSTAILRMKATITTEPKTTYAKQGAAAKVTVKAKGDGLKYTWYIKNAGATKYTKSSVTKSTYSATMGDKVNGRYVYCVVTDKYGKTDKSKTVVLRRSATIVTQPKSVKVANGKTAKVTVKAVGDGLKYTWYIKNAGATKYTKSSVTKSTYSVAMSNKVNGRYVYCVVTDKYGKTEKSKTVSLRMKESPLTITSQPQSTTAAAGDEVGFAIGVTGGTAPYTYQLKRTNGTLNGAWEDVDAETVTTDGVTTLLFTITSNNFLSQDLFCIVVTDAAGNQVTSSVVFVTECVPEVEPLTITAQPQNATAQVGDIATFTVAVEGGTAPYTYKWEYKSGSFDWTAITGSWATGANSDTLSFGVDESEFEYTYQYRCIITDAEGNQVVTDAAWVVEG